MTNEKRRSERIDAYWEQSIRMFVRSDEDKRKVRLVNISDSGVCIEILGHHDEPALADRLVLLFQVGEETDAFSAEVRWIAPVSEEDEEGTRRYGAAIAEGSHSNIGLYRDYVQFLFLSNRFNPEGD